MAGRRPEDHERKKNQLRRSAASLLLDDPLGAASIPNICRGAGLATQAVHYYFDNRTGLLWDIVQGHMTRLLQQIEADTPAGLVPVDCLYAMARAYVAVIETATAEHRMVLAHQQILPKTRHADIRMMQRWLLHAVVTMLRAAAPQALPERVTPLALSLLALLNAHAVWYRDGAGVRRAEYAEMAVRMVLSEAACPPMEHRTGAAAARCGAGAEETDYGTRRHLGADPHAGVPAVGAGRPARRRRSGILGAGAAGSGG